MLPKKHLFYGTIFALILYLIFPKINFIGFLLIIASTVLIDVDHYIYYVFKKKDLSLIHAYRDLKNNHNKFLLLPVEKRKEYYGCFCFFHGLETLIILFLLGFFVSEYFYFIFIGVAFHLSLDYPSWKFYKRIDKVSIIYDFIKFRKLKNINDI